MITINRQSAWGDSLRTYKIFLDGKHIGDIADSESVKLPVNPGEHELYLKIDYARSKKLRFDLQKNENITFECGPSMSPSKALLMPLYLTILKNRYIFIMEVQDDANKDTQTKT